MATSYFNTRLRRSLALWIVGLALASSAHGADSSYLSLTGTFDAATGSKQDIAFYLGGTTTMTFRTWASSGGVNAAGATIAPGGIDSVLELFSGAGATLL